MAAKEKKSLADNIVVIKNNNYSQKQGAMEAVKESELKKTLMIVAIAFFSLMIFKEIAYEIRKAQAINALNDSLEQMSKSFDKIKKKYTSTKNRTRKARSTKKN